MSIQANRRYYLKLKALHYLYERDYSQTEIAKMLGISRMTLKKMLDEAKQEGMIKYQIIDTRSTMQLVRAEEALCTKFHLKDAKVVEVAAGQGEVLNYQIAQEGAQYLWEQFQNNMKLGVAWGQTLNMLFDMINEKPRLSNFDVYTLVGGSGSNCNFQPNVIAQKICAKFKGATEHVINSPFYCRNEALCEAIKEEPQIKSIFDIIPDMDMILVGIGTTPSHSEEFKSYYNFEDSITDELIAASAVGDICANFYDINGNPCNTALNNRVVSVDIKMLKEHNNVIGISGGVNKINAIMGALNGGYLDVLITDSQTAYKIIDIMDGGENLSTR